MSEVRLSFPALMLLVAANPVAAARRVREALSEVPEEKRRAALEKLIAKVGLDAHKAFQLQGLLGPELCVANLAGRNHQMSIRRVSEAFWLYANKYGVSWSGRTEPGDWISKFELSEIMRPSEASWKDVDICVRHRLLYCIQNEVKNFNGETRLIDRYEISPLLVC